ncbi:unnamed protein product [Clonostachys rosea]|uniref:F-box domain-containing protein n=1 Tax=Bionectria ochroleuca TaxID=29856 RepID=A0ABY6U8F4_BIOOC|nr:unnamed protein product [Clonostachys rosea]
MGLAELPTELLWLILERLYCPADLHSAFCASPFLLQAYLAARERIIASMLARVILPVAQRHAIATTGGPVAPKKEQLGGLWNFLEGYFDDEEHDRPTAFPSDRLKLMKLMLLHAQVEQFVEQYYEEAKEHYILFLERQAASNSLEPPPEFAKLSRTEMARFQRAFYRYELYSRCFGVSTRDKWASSCPMEAHYEHFLGRLEPWEVEEMCCVHQFLMGRIAPILGKMQDDIIAMVLNHQVKPTGHESTEYSELRIDDTLAHSETLLIPDNRGSISSSRRDISQGQQSSQNISKDEVPNSDDLCEFQGLAESKLRLFSSQERIWFYHWISDVTSFGLMYIKGFLDSPRDVQYDLFRRNASKRRNFLPHVLKNINFDRLRGIEQEEDQHASPSPITSEEDENNKDGRNNHESLSSPNLGYEMFKDGPSYPTIPFYDNEYWPLRRLGYVFWDSSRVLEPSFRDCLADARDGNDREFDFTNKPSAEEILKGVKLPRRAMGEIREKFGLWPRNMD